VHYTTIEEILAGEVVTAGMFPVNQHPTVFLFDSRASHFFMSQTFASKHRQNVVVALLVLACMITMSIAST
jgi:hypothetical protein